LAGTILGGARAKWIQELEMMWRAQIWDMEIEKARLALEPSPRQEAAHVDWTTLTLDHPAYRRAVPSGRSFLREAEFDNLLLVLSHEIIHILSMLGGVGVMLTCLRVALMNAETVLWSLQAPAGSDMEQFKGRVALEGVAPLERGDPGLLFRTEQALELTLKARILQDVWTPWFEGLAIFGESAADPALDVVTIGEVSNCLRNMVDFVPTSGAEDTKTEDSILAEYEAFAQEFESRCSAAITRHGPVRLNKYLRSPNPSYFAGYLAIRRIVSTWRERAGRSITGPEAFSLLLHATRHGTFETIPDLSLPSELFSLAASKMMLDWASQLAKLDPKEINDYLSHPDRTASGRIYAWETGRLKPVEAEFQETLEERERATVAKRLRQALSSLTSEIDENRVKTADPIERWLIKAMSKKGQEVVENDALQWDNLTVSLDTLATLLPIGQTASKFFANGDPATEWPLLAFSLRTTEHNASDGGPGVNGYWFSVDHGAAELIKNEYHCTGRPRVEVTRVVDLWGLGSATRRPGLHFLAFKYGAWFEIRGASSFADTLINSDAKRKAQVTDLVRRRLYPDPLLFAFQGILARGDDGARRTARWIDESDAWTVDGQTVPVENWVLRTRKLAGRIVALEAERVAMQKAVATALVSTLFGDDELSEMVTAGGFELMTEQFPAKRGQIVDALFNTAKVPVANDQAVYALGFGTDRTPLFTKGLHGWDVAPLH
jgi:hypothetical protein